MKVPTVRVKNPNSNSYMIINQSDLTDEHELWHEQDHDYKKATPVAPVQASKEAEAAVRIFGKMMASQLGFTPEQWFALPSEKRAEHMLAEEPNIDKSLEDRLRYLREQAKTDLNANPAVSTPAQQSKSWKSK